MNYYHLEQYRSLVSADKLNTLLQGDALEKSVRGVADWLEAASDATGEPGLCYRSACFDRTGAVSWTHPHSNTTELITAWLDIAAMVPDLAERSRQRAIAYGLRLVNDPMRGFYQGERKEAWGLAWYWRDDGTYTGGYSMRAPSALVRLYEVAKEESLLETCERIGQTFLQRQLPNGFVSMVGWCPKRGWLMENHAGCRYVYPIATFATIYELTGEEAYREAYEKALEAFLFIEGGTGVIYQHYDPVTLADRDRSIKFHFYSYIFYALEEAYRVFRDDRLIAIARRMADYLVSEYLLRQSLPYCIDPVYPSDTGEGFSSVSDSAAGLCWLYSVTGEPVYFDLAAKLWAGAWLHQPQAPDLPGWHGAILAGRARCDVWYATSHVMAARHLARKVQEKINPSAMLATA